MTLTGELALWVALLMAAWSAITSFAGGRSRRPELVMSGERGVYATWALVTAASAGLWSALLTHDFSFRHVAAHTSANLPAAYTLTAFWAGAQGSLLLWTLLLSSCSALAVRSNRHREATAYVSGTLATVTLFFLAAVCFGANPYERLDWIPPDGVGMHPQLQNPGMAMHPPVLYLGYVATTVPFAFGVAALLTRRLDEVMFATLRRWSLVAWFLLTAAIVAGMWWSYVEQSWTARWARDPVENGSLLSWLMLTTFLSIGARATNVALRRWSVVLPLVAFPAAMLAAFATHGGIVSLVHSFSRSSINRWFAGFLLAALVVTTALVIARLRLLRLEPGDTVRDVTHAIHRRLGRLLVYAGIVVLFAGFSGLAFRKDHDVRLKPGESFRQRDPYGREWTFTSQGASIFVALNRQVTALPLQATRNGKAVGLVSTERRQYVDSRGVPTFPPTIEAGIRVGLLEDVSVVLAGADEGDSAAFRVSFNPLVVWLWIGGLLVAVGGAMTLWPAPTPRVVIT